MQASELNCPSCGTPFKGKYCFHCGEKKLERREMTLSYFFGKVWNALTFTDIKFMRSVGALLFKPGKLTKQFFAGRRKLYTAPLALFFFINLVYFIYQPVDALNSTLTSQISGQFYSEWANHLVEERIEEQGLDRESFAISYNRMSSQLSKLFLIVLVLFFAIGTALINIRKKQLFYFHLITATHYVSFAILSLLILAPLIATLIFYLYVNVLGRGGVNLDPNAWYITLPGLTLLASYALGIQRHLHGERILFGGLKAILLTMAFIISILFYRLFLFVFTIGLV